MYTFLKADNEKTIPAGQCSRDDTWALNAFSVSRLAIPRARAFQSLTVREKNDIFRLSVQQVISWKALSWLSLAVFLLCWISLLSFDGN